MSCIIIKMNKLEKFENDLTYINAKAFHLRVRKRRVGLTELQRIDFKKLKARQKQLRQAVKSLGGK